MRRQRFPSDTKHKKMIDIGIAADHDSFTAAVALRWDIESR
jgi:hypothetical protein